MMTLVAGESRFCLQNGTAVPARVARTLIRRALVEPSQDALFGGSQSYHVPEP
jgi:hypothetical protein